MKQFGVGLAVAVALDAFVVIAVMPALLLLVGALVGAGRTTPQLTTF